MSTPPNRPFGQSGGWFTEPRNDVRPPLPLTFPFRVRPPDSASTYWSTCSVQLRILPDAAPQAELRRLGLGLLLQAQLSAAANYDPMLRHRRWSTSVPTPVPQYRIDERSPRRYDASQRASTRQAGPPTKANPDRRPFRPKSFRSYAVSPTRSRFRSHRPVTVPLATVGVTGRRFVLLSRRSRCSGHGRATDREPQRVGSLTCVPRAA
jgi:hypothetical protein